MNGRVNVDGKMRASVEKGGGLAQAGAAVWNVQYGMLYVVVAVVVLWIWVRYYRITSTSV